MGKEIILNDSNKIPKIGFGVFTITDKDECENAVLNALNCGYRLIDTANAYMNERAVGRAIKKSNIAREEIFLTTKIMPQDFGYEKTKIAIDKTLARLDTPYIDLLLLHIRFGDYLGAWKAMEEAVLDGKIKSIGISNFNEKEILDIINHARIIPAVDQIECHPYFQEKSLRKLLDKYKIQVESYYPLGHGDLNLLNEQCIKEIANKYNKTNAQIILRWHIEEGFIPIPKSTNLNHIKSNIDIFDFKLTKEEIEVIRKLDKNKSYFSSHKISEEEHAKIYLSQNIDFDKEV